MESVLIRIPAADDEATEWVVLDDAGHPHAAIRKGPLSAAVQQIQQRQVIALAPTEDLLIDEVEFPSRSRSKLRQALPYLLEDRLANDIDGMHFAIGQLNGQMTAQKENAGPVKIPVAAINQNKLEQWLERLKTCNITPKIVIPDVLAVPFNEDGEWGVFINNGISLIRTGRLSGFACDTANLNLLLPAAIGELEEPPTRIKIWDYHSESYLELAQVLDHDIEIEPQPSDADALNVLARGLKYNKSSYPINLLQGEYSPQKEYRKLLGPWLPIAAMLGLWLLIGFVSNLISLHQLEQESDQLDQKINEIYKKTFPNDQSAGNPRIKMERKLKTLGVNNSANAGYISMLNVVSKELMNYHPKIRTMSYNKQLLDIEMELANLQQLDELKAKIEQVSAFKADIQSATTQGDAVTGRLRLSEAVATE